MRWVVFPWSQISEPTNKPFLKSGENPARAGTHSGVHFSGGPKSAYPGPEDPKLCFRTPVPLSRVGPLACHARVPERDAECSEDQVSLAPDLARVSHSLPDPAPVARTSHRLQPAWVRSLPGLGPARDCSLNPHLAQARSGDSSWKPGLSPLPDGPRPASGPPSQQTASDLGAPRSFLCSGHRAPPEPRVIVGPTLHTHTTHHTLPWLGCLGRGLCGIALRESSGEEATEIWGHRDMGTRQLPCRQLHARPAVPRHSREAAAAPAGGGDHSLATPPLSHPRRLGRGAGLRRGLKSPGQSWEPALCQTAGGANGRGRESPPALPPGPRPPRYTMAPEEGPLARVPLGELVGEWGLG